MIQEYITSLLNTLNNINLYFVYSQQFSLLSKKELECLKEKVCKIQSFLSELKTLDESLNEDFELFKQIEHFIELCLDDLDITKINSLVYFTYPLSNLRITATTDSTITLEWDYSESTTTRYNLEKSVDGINYVEIATLNGNVKLYQDTDLTHNTEYFYRIRVVERELASDYVFTTGRTLHTQVVDFLGQPESFSSISLEWTNNNFGETGYEIDISNNNINWTNLVTTLPDVENYTVTGLNEGELYYFRIRAINTIYNNPSIYNEISAVTFLISPTLLVDTVLGAEVQLSWQDNSSAETNYVLEQSLDGVNYTVIQGNLPSNTEQFLVTGLNETTQYFYRVKAINLVTESEYSNIVDPVTKLAAPTNLVLSVISDTEIQLTWDDNSIAEDNYEIELSFDQLNWNSIVSLPANTTLYNHVGLEGGIEHFYRVKAVNNVDESPYSSEESVYTTITLTFTTEGFRGDNNLERTLPFNITGVTPNEQLGRVEYSQAPDSGVGAGQTVVNLTTSNYSSTAGISRYNSSVPLNPLLEVKIIFEDPEIEIDEINFFASRSGRNHCYTFESPFFYNLKLNSFRLQQWLNDSYATNIDNLDEFDLPPDLEFFQYVALDNNNLIKNLPDFSNINLKEFTLSVRFNNVFNNFLLRDDLELISITPNPSNTSLGLSLSQSFANGFPNLKTVAFTSGSTSGLPDVNFGGNSLDLSSVNSLEVFSWTFRGLGGTLTLPNVVSNIVQWGIITNLGGGIIVPENYVITNPLKLGEILSNGIITIFAHGGGLTAGWVENITNSKFSDTITNFRIERTQFSGDIIITDARPNLVDFRITGNANDGGNKNVNTLNLSGCFAIQTWESEINQIQNITLPVGGAIEDLFIWGNNIIAANNPNFVTQLSSLTSLERFYFGAFQGLNVILPWDSEPDFTISQGQNTLFNNLSIQSPVVTDIRLTKLGLTGTLTLHPNPTSSSLLLHVSDNNITSIVNINAYETVLNQLFLTNVQLTQNINFSNFTQLELLSMTLNNTQTIVDLSNVTGSFEGYWFRSCTALTTLNIGSLVWNTNSNNIRRGVFIDQCSIFTTITGLENTTLISDDGRCEITNCPIFNFSVPLGVNNFTPRIMLLNGCALNNTNLNTIIDTIYTNRSKWTVPNLSSVKVLNISGQVGGATPSGVEQAPSGFVLGSNDGTPANQREKIFVLKNNYNWAITY